MGTRFSDLTPDAQALYQRGQSSLGFLPNISSGFRTPQENANAKGAPNSDHLTGNAFDIPTRNLTADQQQQVLDYYRSQPGVYVNDERNRPGHGPHIHVSYRGKPGDSAAKGNQGGKGSDDRDGSQKDRKDTTDWNKQQGQKNAPPGTQKHDDIQGSAGQFKRVQTNSAVGRLPTHEPWPYHPKSELGPRQALQGTGSGGGGGGGGGNGGGGNGTSGAGGANGNGITGNQSGSNANAANAANPENAQCTIDAANKLGVDPVFLSTAISYETGGTFDPWKAGPTTKYGQHRGLIQFGQPQAKQFGAHAGQTYCQQMSESVVPYLQSKGIGSGSSFLQIYSAINRGNKGNGDPSDPQYHHNDGYGTTLEHAQKAWAQHRAKGEKMVGAAKAPVSRGDKGMNPNDVNSAPSAPGGGGGGGKSNQDPKPQDRGTSEGKNGGGSSNGGTGTGKASGGSGSSSDWV